MEGGGPPSEAGSSMFQPTGAAKILVCWATCCGVTISSGDLATSMPVVFTAPAPCGKLRTTSTHSDESGIQASTEVVDLPGAWPSIRPATAGEAAGRACTCEQRPTAG